MKKPNPDSVPALLDADDRSLIEAVDAAYRPAPMAVARRAALQSSIEMRLARRRPWRAAALAASGLCAAAIAGWIVIQPAAPEAAAEVDVVAAATGVWEEQIVSALELGMPEADGEAFLPDEYAAIADSFVGF